MTLVKIPVAPRARMMLACVASLPVFFILGATGHLHDSLATVHGAILTLLTSQLLARASYVLLARILSIAALIDIPLSVYVAITGTVIYLPKFNAEITVFALIFSVAAFIRPLFSHTDKPS